MVMQVSHSNRPKVQAKNHLQPVQERLARNYKDAVQIQASRDIGRAHDARPCTPAVKYPAKDERIKFYGILERKKCPNDV